MIDPAALDRLFEGEVATDAPGCVAALLHGDRIVWSRCLGQARLGEDSPLTPATRFRIASITKPMVALVIAALEDAGQLSLTDPLSRHIVEHRFDADPTLGQILAMQSGIPETYPLVWLALGTGARLEGDARALLALLLAQTQLNFAPGERTLYANANTILLQLVAERVSGQPLAALLAAHVFAPAEMAGAVLDDGLAHRLPGTAMAYGRDAHGFVLADPPSVEAAPGGVIASLDAMIAWHRWLRGNPMRWQERLAAPVTHIDGSISGYAHGFVRQTLSGVTVVGHAGGHSGWASDYLYAPDADVAAIILANRNDINWYERCREMLVTALGLPPDPGATPRLLGPAPDHRWQRTYASVDALCSITVNGCALELEVNGRRMPRAADGGFARTLGVEPFTFPPCETAEPPPVLIRHEGNQLVTFQRIDTPQSLDESLLTGSYASIGLPHPVTIARSGDGSLRISTGPAWPSGERWQLRPVCGPLYRCHLPDGSPSEVHLRFERDVSGAVIALSIGFVRIPCLTLHRIGDPAETLWQERIEAAPRLMEGGPR